MMRYANRAFPNSATLWKCFQALNEGHHAVHVFAGNAVAYLRGDICIQGVEFSFRPRVIDNAIRRAYLAFVAFRRLASKRSRTVSAETPIVGSVIS
jgi:hypothetical protein